MLTSKEILLQRLADNAKRQKQVNKIAADLRAARSQAEPDIQGSKTVELAARPSPQVKT